MGKSCCIVMTYLDFHRITYGWKACLEASGAPSDGSVGVNQPVSCMISDRPKSCSRQKVRLTCFFRFGEYRTQNI